jgi:hypothetical protein
MVGEWSDLLPLPGQRRLTRLKSLGAVKDHHALFATDGVPFGHGPPIGNTGEAPARERSQGALIGGHYLHSVPQPPGDVRSFGARHADTCQPPTNSWFPFSERTASALWLIPTGGRPSRAASGNLITVMIEEDVTAERRLRFLSRDRSTAADRSILRNQFAGAGSPLRNNPPLRRHLSGDPF